MLGPPLDHRYMGHIRKGTILNHVHSSTMGLDCCPEYTPKPNQCSYHSLMWTLSYMHIDRIPLLSLLPKLLRCFKISWWLNKERRVSLYKSGKMTETRVRSMSQTYYLNGTFLYNSELSSFDFSSQTITSIFAGKKKTFSIIGLIHFQALKRDPWSLPHVLCSSYSKTNRKTLSAVHYKNPIIATSFPKMQHEIPSTSIHLQ